VNISYQSQPTVPGPLSGRIPAIVASGWQSESVRFSAAGESGWASTPMQSRRPGSRPGWRLAARGSRPGRCHRRRSYAARCLSRRYGAVLPVRLIGLSVACRADGRRNIDCQMINQSTSPMPPPEGSYMSTALFGEFLSASFPL
jgi:hypothetical protein